MIFTIINLHMYRALCMREFPNPIRVFLLNASINKSKQTDLSLSQPPPNVQFLWSVLLLLGTSDQDQSSHLRLHLHVVSESNDDVLA